ncbi:L-aspartate oxidase (plasmid) [Legionella adelaidensis]|uniref:L-aspartate oxidase n=1 Tax=Legionella adelaidensis TaxID=45056 RepID=A0A0W0R4M5_9GAMM|nr:L-aspartate oxidase [Legionella adelaidensis]KTC66022.1 L-aspartate oxidase [Legionella adelaidensis]VEH85763.1 L-aspartate oxidase [Legionella adelaidensis]
MSTQTGNTYEYDVLVIGSGLAGLHFCLQLIQKEPKIKIALICKVEALECNSRYAQGGIAASYLPEDSIESHIKDTLRAGDGLCFKPAVKAIINKAPEVIKQLEGYSVQFNRSKEGNYALAKEGGHSHRRIFNCGDKTGLNTIEALLHLVRLQPSIHLFEHHVAINLITHYHPHNTRDQGEVLGAYILDCKNDLIHAFAANSVVLATGGAGKTYRYTTNPMVATGDGVAMAYRAGARVGNMEFYQFHPTLLYHHEVNNFLISEAVRGEGGLLKTADTYERFMHKYAPEQMELATRDVVARAIFNEIEHGDKSFVYLDITHQSKTFLKKRFPHIYETLLSIGIDISQDMIPVVPAAHYQCGGVLTNLHGQTDLRRLYAIGEVAFTGLHGANRLASNSLLEAVVMAGNAAESCIKDIKSPSKFFSSITSWSSPGEVNERRASQINAQWRSVRGEMTSYAGIIRTEAGLQDLLQLIRYRNKIIEEYYWKHRITRDFVELRNIILNAELIVRSALSRRESRGGHFREDFPHKDPMALESISRLNSPQHPFI